MRMRSKAHRKDLDLALFGGICLGIAGVGDVPLRVRIAAACLAAAIYSLHCIRKEGWGFAERTAGAIASLLICSFLAVEVYRNRPADPPLVRIHKFLPLRSGPPEYQFNAPFWNSGGEVARDLQWSERARFEERDSGAAEDRLFSELYASLNERPPLNQLPGEDHGININIELPATQEDVSDFHEHRKNILVGILIRYHDKTGAEQFREYCRQAVAYGSLGFCVRHPDR